MLIRSDVRDCFFVQRKIYTNFNFYFLAEVVCLWCLCESFYVFMFTVMGSESGESGEGMRRLRKLFTSIPLVHFPSGAKLCDC